jgi:TPR repeat protein
LAKIPGCSAIFDQLTQEVCAVICPPLLYSLAIFIGIMNNLGVFARCPSHAARIGIEEAMALNKKDAKIFTTLKKAAESGNSEAQVNLAAMVLEGRGSQLDPEVARKWYEKAAEWGEPGAHYGLALIYLEGNGVSKDKVEAYARLLAMKSGEVLLKKRFGPVIAKRMLDSVSRLEVKLSDQEKEKAVQRSRSFVER